MQKTLTLLALAIVLLATILLQSFEAKPASGNRQLEVLNRANLFNLRFPQEKIYLHVDRSAYWANEDIWFKAYLLNSPIKEGNLKVELINAAGTVIYKKTLWSQFGLAYGDIHLSDTLSSGMYQIRAYTNWMRNFDEQFFFTKDLVIWNLRDKAVETITEELKPREVDVQFFPEGGTFIANLKNRVAFKAVDPNGKALDLEGLILDDLGQKVADIKSGKKGMGSFILEPLEGRKYFAQIQVAGRIDMKVDLPEAQTSGLVMAVDNTDQNLIRIQISDRLPQPENDPEVRYFLVGQSNGEICYCKEVVSAGNTTSLEINKSNFPTGIVKFTLFDEAVLPRCERLVFVNHHDAVAINIAPGKSEYVTRENVTLDIKAIDQQGLPVLGNLSLSVYHPASQLKTEGFDNNILTHFLLNSELKGNLEDPAWYFKDDSLTTRIALDHVMLTHGYRYFEWKAILGNHVPEIEFQPEEAIQLKGKVSDFLLGKPIRNGQVTMMSVKSQLWVREEKTDSLGQFLFSNLFFNDTIEVSLQVLNQKGRRNAVVELDLRSGVSPQAGRLPITYQYNREDPAMTTSFLGAVSSELINRKWRLSDTILLQEINILAQKRKIRADLDRPYTDAVNVFDVAKVDDIYSDIFETIENTSPYLRRFLEKGPAYFLNGVPVNPDFLVGLPASWFDKVEAVQMAPVGGGWGPGIFFYSKRGAPQRRVYNSAGMKSIKIVGYSVIRQFYAPHYENQPAPEVRNDFRSTLYWNPVVRTDSTGTARVNFYNSDETGPVQVVVEGVTPDGRLCRGVCRYRVTY